MQYLDPKTPGETVNYLIPWSRQLDADLIDTFTLTVTSGTVVIAPDPLNFGQFLQATISGGVDGETAVLHCQIVTLGKQTLERDISLLVAEDATAITPSTTTKRTLVNMIYEEMTLSGFEFDSTPEEQFSILRRIDAQMADWRTQGLDLGYNFPPYIGGGDLDDPAGIEDNAVNATVLWCALRAMPAIGKTESTESRTARTQALSALRAAYAVIPDRVLQAGTPRGAGQKPYGVWQPFGFNGGTS